LRPIRFINAQRHIGNTMNDSTAWRRSRTLFYLLMALVALAPLPLASDRPLPGAVLCLSVGLLLLFWAVDVALPGGRLAVSVAKVRWPLVLYGIVCVWIFVQWLPLAPPQWADPIWSEASRLVGAPVAGRISVNPGETLSGLMRLLAYGGVFWLSLQLGRDTGRAQTAMRWIAAIGALYAAYGIIVYLTGNHWVLVYRKWAYPHSLTSTFVNRNAFAIFLGICLLCAFSGFLDRMGPALALKRPFRQKTVFLVETLTTRAAFPAAVVAITVMALLLTTSRAGVFCSCLGLLVLAVLFMRIRTLNWRHAAVMAAVAAVILLPVVLSSGGGLFSRQAVDKEALLARAPTSEVVAEIETSPWRGTGFGTFQDVFPAYRDRGDKTLAIWDKAHNTYLENAAEIGIPATILLNLAVLLLAARALAGTLTRRRNQALPAIGVAASVIVGLHSTVDFSLEIPAVAVLYACVMGIAVSQSWSSADKA
jgi:O-antigen ligase